jgi:hypothetical protein
MANISLTIRSDFEQAERDFRELMAVSEQARAKFDKMQQSFKTENIDKFMARNRLNAVAIRATQGSTAALTAETAGLQREIQRLIRAGLSPEDEAVRKLRTEYARLNTELQEHSSVAARSSGARSTSNMLNYAYAIGMVYAALNVGRQAWSMFIEPAMQAEEAASKFQTIFGESSANVTSWADELAVAIGRSSRELQGMAADAMALISPMSGSRDAAIQMSQGLVQMAQDLASFHNVDVGEAFTALRSGISGETEPMKRFGILLTDAALAEYALSQGITRRISDMSTAEKTQLRYNAMLNSMGTAQGDAARTSGSLTNQLRALEGCINDVNVSIGERSVEGMTQLARGMAMVADQSSILVRGAQEASGAVGGLSDIMGREMQAEAYGRRLLETYDSLGLIDDILIATTADMSAALGTAGLGGIVNVMGMLKTDFGRLRVEYAVTTQQVTAMSMTLAGRYGSIEAALQNSTDSQVQQFIRLRENLERLSETAKRTLQWDLSNGWLANIASGAAGTSVVLESLTRAQAQYNQQQQQTRSSAGRRSSDRARELDQRVQFEQQWVDRVRQSLMEEDELRQYSMELRLANNEIEYERALAQAQRHQADRTNIDAYYSRQRIRIQEEESEKRTREYIGYAQTMIGNTHSMFQDIYTVMQNFGKEAKGLTYILKALAMAEAAINSYLAFTQVLADKSIWPTWARLPIAATILAAGLAKQAAIATTPISAETGISSYTVPDIRANRNDNAAVHASAGEQVTVTPRGESAESQTSVNISVGEEVIYRVVQRGISTGKININNRNIGRSVFMQ